MVFLLRVTLLSPRSHGVSACGLSGIRTLNQLPKRFEVNNSQYSRKGHGVLQLSTAWRTQ